MTMYTFHLCSPDGGSNSFEALELINDSAAYPMAGRLLMQHPSCDYVAVWADERPVLSRHRDAPFIRPVNKLAAFLQLVP